MERALLEGEQQIQLEHLESAKEKVASLEAKEARLLAEAAAERAKVPVTLCCMFLIMVALCNRADHYIFILFLSSSSFFPSPNLSGRRLDVYHTLAHGVTLVRI